MKEVSESSPWWGLSWAWVGGYTSVSTLVIVFNSVLLFSVITNKYLHYSFNYVLVMLSIRNVCRVILTLSVLVFSKMLDSPSLLQSAGVIPPIIPTGLDLSQAENMPLVCKVISLADHLLMIILMYYLASLSLYVFCRKANPSVTTTSDVTLRLYGLNSGIVPVKERKWISPLLLFLPLLLATLLALPVFLLEKPHPISVVPECTLCQVSDSSQYDIYQSSVIILGFYLPSTIIFFLTICLSVRRCFSCSSDRCVSSFCKEEMTICFLALPYILTYLAIYLPHMDHFLYRLSLPQTSLQEQLTPAIVRGVETVMGLLLPIVVYSTLPAYTKFSSSPDDSDVKNEVHRASRTPSRRISVASEFAHL